MLGSLCVCEMNRRARLGRSFINVYIMNAPARTTRYDVLHSPSAGHSALLGIAEIRWCFFVLSCRCALVPNLSTSSRPLEGFIAGMLCAHKPAMDLFRNARVRAVIK